MTNNLYHQGLKALANENHGKKALVHPDGEVTLDNPLCGDRVSVAIQLVEGRINKEAHEVKGCMICRASANAMSASVVGLTESEVHKVILSLEALLKAEDFDDWPIPGWEKLSLFEPVANHKSRRNCVLLPFRALAETFKQATSCYSEKSSISKIY